MVNIQTVHKITILKTNKILLIILIISNLNLNIPIKIPIHKVNKNLIIKDKIKIYMYLMDNNKEITLPQDFIPLPDIIKVISLIKHYMDLLPDIK